VQKKLICFFALIYLLLFSGCTQSRQIYAMDTVITMEVSGLKAKDAIQLAEEEILRLEQLLSIRGGNSEVAALNNRQIQTVSEDTAQVLQAALSLSRATGGAYDCTIAPVAEAWGWYDSPTVPSEEELSQALALVNHENLLLDGNSVEFRQADMGIDLGGIAKGYAAETLGNLLKNQGIQSGLISLGGNIRAIGKKTNSQPWIIGIADPSDPASYVATVAVEDTAVVTSGDYQRFFTENDRTYHHILDPKTGKPAENGLHSVTIVCQNDTMADGLSTALFVMGLEDASSFWKIGWYDFEAIFIADSGLYITEGLRDCFACQTSYEVISR